MLNTKNIPKLALKRTIIAIMLVVFGVSSAITVIGLKISSNYTLDSVNTMKRDMLSVYQQEIETIFGLISQQVDLFLLNNEVWKMVYSDVNDNDYVVIRNVLNEVKNHYFMSNLVESMYFFDKKHSFVLADGCYPKTNFFDPIVLTDTFINRSPISDVRTVNDREIFSLLYQPLLTVDENPVTIVVNISVARLEEFLPFSPLMGHFVMTNQRNEILYTTDTAPHARTLIEQTLSAVEAQNVISVDSQDYLVTRSSLANRGICLYIFQDYQTATHSRTILRSLVLPTSMMVLVAGVFLILAVAFYLYRPLHSLISSLDLTGFSANATSEYALIDQAFKQLATSRSEMERKYHEAAHYRAQFMLQEFLINPIFNAKEFTVVLQSLGIHFDAQIYTLFVFELKQQRENGLRHIVMPAASVYGPLVSHVASRISRNRIAVLVNCRFEETASLRPLGENVQLWFREQGYSVSAVQSEAFMQLEELPLTYNQCDTLLRERVFWENGQTVISSGNEPPNSYVQAKRELFSAIKVGNEENAATALSRTISLLTDQYSPDGTDLLRHHLAEICLEIAQLTQSNDSETLPATGYMHFQRICMSQTLSGIRAELEALIHQTLEQNNQLSQKRNSELVATAQKYIDDNVTRNLSLDDISQAVYLSTNYFCSIFKTETGITVMDYVTKKKIEMARQLLLENPSMQINVLSSKLGYNSVQSFIRQFKKVMKNTPDQYRKEHLQNAAEKSDD